MRIDIALDILGHTLAGVGKQGRALKKRPAVAREEASAATLPQVAAAEKRQKRSNRAARVNGRASR